MTGDGAVWIIILGSLALAVAAACLFVFSVKRNLFENLEDAKYHVFWADHDGPSARPAEGDSAHAREDHAR